MSEPSLLARAIRKWRSEGTRGVWAALRRRLRAWYVLKIYDPFRLVNLFGRSRLYRRLVRGRSVRRFHRLYYHNRQRTFDDTYWMGVHALKCPLDLWAYQEILAETRPDLIVESGTFMGGTTLYLAHLCDILGHGRVIGIDVSLEFMADAVRNHPRVRLIEGSSLSDEVVQAVREEAEGKRAMVILDADHRADHVLREMRLYAPIVSPGCYLVVEDTNLNGNPVYPRGVPGPNQAVKSFLREERGMQVDLSREKFLLTFNPGGYLLKKSPGSSETEDRARKVRAREDLLGPLVVWHPEGRYTGTGAPWQPKLDEIVRRRRSQGE